MAADRVAALAALADALEDRGDLARARMLRRLLELGVVAEDEVHGRHLRIVAFHGTADPLWQKLTATATSQAERDVLTQGVVPVSYAYAAESPTAQATELHRGARHLPLRTETIVVVHGSTREQRPAAPRRRGSRRVTGTGSRAGPDDSDPDAHLSGHSAGTRR